MIIAVTEKHWTSTEGHTTNQILTRDKLRLISHLTVMLDLPMLLKIRSA